MLIYAGRACGPKRRPAATQFSMAGRRDRTARPPQLGRVVAEGIPGARFVVLGEEAHQPFQERPDEFNALVDEFWRTVDRSA
ncbi:MAG TPA: alpha/beta hydrolase [Acidimicrobiales bacterium]|nr:alpha/beta hydrolase [Acidimicrobiales bacterium]